MAENASDGVDDGRLDLVPMIDCIMLLLLFFMMTTKFSSEEKAISSLLPTDKGTGSGAAASKDPPQMVNICIYPGGMTKGYEPAGYLNQLTQLQTGTIIQSAQLRIGNREPVLIEGRWLKSKAGKEMEMAVETIHQYVREELVKFEKEGQPRDKQNDVVIHCFSGLSWKFALVVYDAVRAYEGEKSHLKYTGDPEELKNARAVTFAPPRVRDYAADALGNELFEIIHMK